MDNIWQTSGIDKMAGQIIIAFASHFDQLLRCVKMMTEIKYLSPVIVWSLFLALGSDLH